MQAGRSLRNTKAKNLLARLLYSRHSFTSTSHSAQVWKPFSMQHLRILHHEAFSFSLHPGHFPIRYFLQAPQYSPQAAIISLLTVISFICKDLCCKDNEKSESLQIIPENAGIGLDCLLYWYLNDGEPFLWVFLVPRAIDVAGAMQSFSILFFLSSSYDVFACKSRANERRRSSLLIPSAAETHG